MKTAIITASGPSLTQEQVDAAQRSGHFTIVVNCAYKIAPWADVLYAGDFMWFKMYLADVKRVFKGKLWTQDSSASSRYAINRMPGTSREGLGKKNVIHLNGNSGMQALNLAFLWGYRRIILLGFDMKLGPKGERHFHADHPHPAVQNQVFGEWLHKAQKVAKDLTAEGVEVLNATPGSALKCFPMVDWKEVLK